MSIINDKSELIFIHVPKVAGSSMERLPWVGGAGHKTAQELRKVAGEKWLKYLSFGFVRHPLDRLLSAYCHFVEKPEKLDEPTRQREVYRTIKHHAATYSDNPVAGFVRFVLSPELRDYIKTVNHFLPQSHFLCDSRGLVMVNFVGKYEALEADWRYVCQILDQPTEPLQHKNAGSPREPWQKWYTPEAAEAACRYYAADFKVFTYEAKL